MDKVLKQRIVNVIIPLVAVIALILAGYFYLQVRTLKQDPQVAAQKEVADLVAKVGKLVLLPEGEIPTVATVADPAALKDQLFFALAQKGDKVLIYTTAKKAFLYSVTMNKIIEIAPLNIGTSKAVTPPANTSTTTPTKK